MVRGKNLVIGERGQGQKTFASVSGISRSKAEQRSKESGRAPTIVEVDTGL